MKDTVIINNNFVEKLFSKGRLPISSKIERAHIILSSLNLKYIQTPTKLYYNSSKLYIKYKAPFFDDSSKNYEDFLLTKIKLLIQNLKELEKEIDIISENRILMRDVYSKNITFNKILRIIDPGSYTYEEKRTIEKIKIFNYEKLRLLIISLIYDSLKSKSINDQDLSYLAIKLNSETRKCSSIINYLEDIDNKEQTLENYVLRRLKNK